MPSQKEIFVRLDSWEDGEDGDEEDGDGQEEYYTRRMLNSSCI